MSGNEVTVQATGDKRADEIKEMARRHAELAIETLANIAGDDEAKDAARVKAADILLQRGFGAPERKSEQKVDITVYDERTAHLDALRRLGDRRNAAKVIEAEILPPTKDR